MSDTIDAGVSQLSGTINRRLHCPGIADNQRSEGAVCDSTWNVFSQLNDNLLDEAMPPTSS
ncbi:MAG: hypothetical protein Q4P33_09685 [Flaviflexus sp.]|nr:hypothetical protein [Flaviflexus sp.]